MRSRNLIVAGVTLGALFTFLRAGFGALATLVGVAVTFLGALAVTSAPRSPRGPA